ncbi:LiaF transmembrane domain-containing protein [Candidatus Leptofilum sp.]|uniref:LiaF transmembrane domain-containing protein n=1 Tax=Candidatus Leptofilum sp. TaxID=3241576 RepID=UPI003B5B4CC1
MSDTIESLKDAEKEAMEAENQPRSVREHRGNITGGLILIGIGTIFLLSQFTGWYIQNWWALFIFIPAILKLNEVWQRYQADGRLTHETRGSLFGGILLGMVGSFFLFSISWNLFWPLVLILLGAGALLNGRS